MKSKKLFLFSTLLVLSIFLSACGGAAYTSSSWHGMITDAGYVYQAAGQQVYKVDLNTGVQKWKFPDKGNAKGFYATPVLTADGQLLVASYDHYLYSVDPNTGIQKWQSNGGESEGNLKNRLVASPLVIQDRIYQPSTDGNIYVLDLANGNIINTIALGKDPLWAQPATTANCNCIYIASMDHHVYSYDIRTGNKIWEAPPDLGGSVPSKPTIGEDGTLYVGSFGSKVFALDGTTGQVKWSFPTQDWVWASPLLDNGILYVGDLSGNLYAVNATDGSSDWAVKPNTAIVDTPVISGTNIYLTTEKDSLYTISSSAGDVTNTAVVGGEILAAPLITGDKILIAPTTGMGSTLIVALSLDNPSGPQKWVFPPPK